MKTKTLVAVIIFAVVCLESIDFAAAQSPPRTRLDTIGSADKLLASFVHLGFFVDRGVAVSPFFDFEEDAHANKLAAQYQSLPMEVQELLLLQRRTPTLVDVELPWILTEKKPASGGVAVARFSRLGLVELFSLTESGILDSPIESRKGIGDKLVKIADDSLLVHRSFFTRGLTRDDKIIAVGTLRRLSVELDMAILSVLSEQERIRLAQLVVHFVPIAQKLADQDHDCYELGSRSLLLKSTKAPGATVERKP